jgi:hypothetical protein
VRRETVMDGIIRAARPPRTRVVPTVPCATRSGLSHRPACRGGSAHLGHAAVNCTIDGCVKMRMIAQVRVPARPGLGLGGAAAAGIDGHVGRAPRAPRRAAPTHYVDGRALVSLHPLPHTSCTASWPSPGLVVNGRRLGSKICVGSVSWLLVGYVIGFNCTSLVSTLVSTLVSKVTPRVRDNICKF